MVIGSVGLAELEGVLAGDVEGVVAGDDGLLVAAVDAQSVGARGEKSNERGREPHGRLGDRNARGLFIGSERLFRLPDIVRARNFIGNVYSNQWGRW